MKQVSIAQMIIPGDVWWRQVERWKGRGEKYRVRDKEFLAVSVSLASHILLFTSHFWGSTKKRRMELAPSGVMATQLKNLPFLGGSFLLSWRFFLSRCLFGNRFFLSRRFLLCGQCTHPLSKLMRHRSRSKDSPTMMVSLWCEKMNLSMKFGITLELFDCSVWKMNKKLL